MSDPSGVINDYAKQAIIDGIARMDATGMADYLRKSRRFHKYSFHNRLLIWCQNPDATMVAGYGAWPKHFSRYVRKGEKSLKIYAPHQRKEIDPVTKKETTRTGFHIASVFDISQTDGEPFELPDIENPMVESDETALEHIACLEAWASQQGITVVSGASEHDNARGYYRRKDRLIWIDPSLTPVHKLRVLFHELGHHCDHETIEKVTERYQYREIAETKADAAAFTLMLDLGYDPGDEIFQYISLWTQEDRQTIIKTAFSELDTIVSMLRQAVTIPDVTGAVAA